MSKNLHSTCPSKSIRSRVHNVPGKVRVLREERVVQGKDGELHDPTSANFHMEELPLSINELTLAALVAPRRSSSYQ
ncbi:hypothetical protein BDQ12DRAFT_684357 [Crucibulum laeve]|uniref:Uncharacterized protein n=1 Tax=Crucibulum laeve TaxID=68775 RepID=A0A5C3LZD2_9AGAR|nr:hypothetical protein BDQ12DRAFT_684357 [Crucibulum laeve]